jgi:DNA-directed RNA polymerase specialized sigma subunit
MEPGTDSAAALDWVLAKLSAAKKGVAAPVFKPPEFKPPKPVAPAFVPKVPTLLQPGEMEAQRQKTLTAKRKTEHELWEKWRHGGQKAEDFEALLKSHMPLLNKHLSRFGGVEVNKPAMKSVLIEHYRKALEKFDPSHEKGAQLHSWSLKGLKRFVVKHQNIARITEPVAENITPFRTAQAELSQRLGYDPTVQQIVDHTHTKDWTGSRLSMKEALQVHKLVKRGLDLGGGGDEVEGAGVRYNDPHLQAAHIIYHDLKPHEQKVHELLFPRSGQEPIYRSGAIAKKLGWEVSKVSKAKKSIFDRIQERVRD